MLLGCNSWSDGWGNSKRTKSGSNSKHRGSKKSLSMSNERFSPEGFAVENLSEIRVASHWQSFERTHLKPDAPRSAILVRPLNRSEAAGPPDPVAGSCDQNSKPSLNLCTKWKRARRVEIEIANVPFLVPSPVSPESTSSDRFKRRKPALLIRKPSFKSPIGKSREPWNSDGTLRSLSYEVRVLGALLVSQKPTWRGRGSEHRFASREAVQFASLNGRKMAFVPRVLRACTFARDVGRSCHDTLSKSVQMPV